MSPARARTRSACSGVKRTNHEATAPPTPSSQRKTKWLLSVYCHKEVTLWAASYLACVLYTKTIIHLSVGESGGYLPPLRQVIVKYLCYEKLLRDLDHSRVC